MQTGRIRQCIMYRMAQRCVDIMNVKNVETGFWRYRQDRSVVCPYCGEEPDMEVGPDEEMPVAAESAKLIQVVKGAEEVERMDTLLSLAVTGGDYAWI